MIKKLRKILIITVLFFSVGATAQEAFIAEIRMFAGNFAPRDWALCDGQLLPISQHSALFSILGTMYGGDGRTTFALPDLRGRVAIHPGQGPGLSYYNQGAIGGSETNTLTTNQLPSHNHSVNAVTATGNQTSPTGNLVADSGLFDNEYSNANADTTLKSTMIENTGGGQPVNNIQPYGTVNYIIALYGTFPTRN